MKDRKPSAVVMEKVEGTADIAQRLRRLARRSRFSALATLSSDGPHLSLIAFAITADLREIVFATPRNTAKYMNIIADPRVSILLGAGEGKAISVMHAEAIALDGKASVVRRGKRRNSLEELLLAIHPELKDFLAAPTTALVAIKVETSTHVEDFQRVSVRSTDRERGRLL